MPADLNTEKGKNIAINKIRPEIRAAMYDIGDYVVSKAKKYPPRPPNSTYNRTGTLGRSIAYQKVKKSGTTYSMQVGTNVPYGPFLEHGTGIHGPKGVPITPKKGMFLVWTANTGGKIFAKSVQGIKPWHFMENALTSNESQSYMLRRYTNLVDRIAILLGQ